MQSDFETHFLRIVNSADTFPLISLLSPVVYLLFADLGDGFNEWIFNIFPRNYTFSFHIDQISLIIECLQAKLGFAFVVRSAVQRELLKRELVEVKLVDIHPPTIASYMVINKKRKKAPGVQRWLELIGAP